MSVGSIRDIRAVYQTTNMPLKYHYTEKHRGGEPEENKSKWLDEITFDGEIKLFVFSFEQYLDDKGNRCYGYLLAQDFKPQVLGRGKTASGTEIQLLFAKFTGEIKENGTWHGYPTNFLRGGKEAPPSTILKE